MPLTRFALRRPLTVMVAALAVALGAFLAVGPSLSKQLGWPYPEGLPKGMGVDIFPALNLPTIYVCQPYGGMDPAQMEGYLTNYYEYHFLYVSGIKQVESRNVQGVALMKLTFHPGTDMSQAMAETINYVNRSQAFMPPGTVSPFVMRFDTGSVPVGYLVLSSETRSISEIQDLALFRVRPMFAALPGVSAPPPFGGSARTVVVTLDPRRLEAQGMSPEEVAAALAQSNAISPSGNIPVGDKYPIVPVNSVIRHVADFADVPVRLGEHAIYLRDVAEVHDGADAPSGYALVNGRRAIYILATKRADASTMNVIEEIKGALPAMQEALPDDIRVDFEFDQSPFVTRAVSGVVTEGLLGAVLVGLMVLLFIGDWRSALVVVLNIPLALLAAVLALWLSNQTINVMTLGGLALAIGILVDEATVAVENIHAHLARGQSLAVAVRDGAAETAVPRLLAMLCILAVFVSSFFMEGAARGLFVPLSLAVGFAMIASYLLSSTFVPVLCVWLLRGHTDGAKQPGFFGYVRQRYVAAIGGLIAVRWLTVGLYGILCAVILYMAVPQLGRDIFPAVDSGQFRLRLRAADGTHIVQSEAIAKRALEIVSEEVGAENVELTLGYVGMIPSNFPVNAVYQWSRGPEEAILLVKLRDGAPVRVDDLKERLRDRLARDLPEARCSFEPSDIINEVMSFGSPTPIEVSISGPDFGESRAFAAEVMEQLEGVAALRDLQYGQSLDYPTVRIEVDRQRAGLAGLTPVDVSRAVVTATSSTRFTMPNYWADPNSGIAYQVQVEMPRSVVRPPSGIDSIGSAEALGRIPLRSRGDSSVLVRDIATTEAGTMPGQFDRYNMRRQVTLTANIAGVDLGSVARQVQEAVTRAGEPPRGTRVELLGQLPPMHAIQNGLGIGLLLAILMVFLLLTANFQSIRLALVTVSTAPAVIAGVSAMLWLTGTTLNIQSFIGAIMGIGVAMANAILLVTFAENRRRGGMSPAEAAASGAGDRMRAILMTSSAMIAGMLPLALALGEGGEQNAPLGLAVIGGLLAATVATLWVLPAVFALVLGSATTRSSSLDPDDPGSAHYFDPSTT